MAFSFSRFSAVLLNQAISLSTACSNWVTVEEGKCGSMYKSSNFKTAILKVFPFSLDGLDKLFPHFHKRQYQPIEQYILYK